MFAIYLSKAIELVFCTPKVYILLNINLLLIFGTESYLKRLEIVLKFQETQNAEFSRRTSNFQKHVCDVHKKVCIDVIQVYYVMPVV